MKYIRHKTLGLLVFECRHNHRKLLELLGIPETDIEAAGFVVSADPTGPHLKCGGCSVSLCKAANDRDTSLVNENIRVAEYMAHE